MRAFGLAVVKNLAFVAANALRHDDFALANSAPFTSLLAELTCAAFRPALDFEYREFRDQTKCCPKWAQKPTI